MFSRVMTRVPQRGYASALPSHNMLETLNKSTQRPFRLTSLRNETFVCVDEETMLNVRHIAMIERGYNEIRFILDSTLGYTAKTREFIKKYADSKDAQKDYEYLQGTHNHAEHSASHMSHLS